MALMQYLITLLSRIVNYKSTTRRALSILINHSTAFAFCYLFHVYIYRRVSQHFYNAFCNWIFKNLLKQVTFCERHFKSSFSNPYINIKGLHKVSVYRVWNYGTIWKMCKILLNSFIYFIFIFVLIRDFLFIYYFLFFNNKQ